ncbi:MAG: DNA gyrase subunit A [Elusimicrobiota bacterium]
MAKKKDDNLPIQNLAAVMPRNIEEEMKKSYIDYAMSVIVGRALPDVRDGLKPVHRRILFAMKEIGLVHSKAFKKSATVVGDVLGKYHPHGDTAVYDTMVRMVQDFSLRYPLVRGQGNFGSIDGDSAAAYRYTEVKMNLLAEEMLKDIDKQTVNFMPNFDGSREEPTVLPSSFPNLLVNGSSGIAVGMATNIPPHNLTEVIDGVSLLIENPDADIKELNKIIKGPDFPTGAMICGRSGITSAYSTGRGSVKVRAICEIEEHKGKERIIVTEIPYQVNKSNLLSTIAELVKDKKILGISDLRDESNREGMRIIIEIKREGNAQVVLNQLYKHTQLESSFGMNMIALVNNRPRLLNIKEMLVYYIEHRKEVVTRRIQFELTKAEERAHILEGLLKAIDYMDEIIKLIRASQDGDIARVQLMAKYSFSKRQAQAILDMRLHQLTALERGKLEEEYGGLKKLIEELKSILKDPKKLMKVIHDELLEIKNKYGDKRRTKITGAADDLDMEDLIDEEDVVVTISHAGYVKRMPTRTYRAQNRGGKGITGMTTKEEDFIEDIITTSTHAYMLFFTNLGRVYWLKVYEIPEAGRTSKGKAIVNLIQLSTHGEKITAAIPIREFSDGMHYLIMITKQGNIKKTDLAAFSRPRKKGITTITLEENDTLVEVKLTDGTQEAVIATRNGLAIHFAEKDVRSMGRAAKGVRGIRLKQDDYVIGMDIVEENGTFLIATENGYGKRTKISEYRVQGRGGKGIINIKTTEKNGKVIGVKTVSNEDEIIFITHKGIINRQSCKGISVIGRNAQGVRLLKFNHGDTLVSMARIKPEAQGMDEE